MTSHLLTFIAAQELDIQYTVGLATGVPVTYYFIGWDSHDNLDGYIDEANYLLGLKNPPLVLTTSYARAESSISFKLTEYGSSPRRVPDKTDAPHSKLCHLYAQLGARGTTILFGSGDNGPGCATGKGKSNMFSPTFPSNCP